MGFNKDAVIVAQNSATAAATIVASMSPKSIEQALEAFDTIREAIFEGSLALAQGDTAEALPASSAAPRRSNGYSRGNNRGGNSGGGDKDPGTVDFRGGKYAGKTIASVYDEDPSYLDWCVSNLNNEFMVGRISEYLASVN